MRSTELLPIGEVIGSHVRTAVFRSISGGMQWFYSSCQRAYDAKQTAYRAWTRVCNADHWSQFVLTLAEANRVYCAAEESHDERTRNSLKHFICSH